MRPVDDLSVDLGRVARRISSLAELSSKLKEPKQMGRR